MSEFGVSAQKNMMTMGKQGWDTRGKALEVFSRKVTNIYAGKKTYIHSVSH
jgi:hypothetical protein